MLVELEDWRVAVPQAQSSVNNTAGPTKYLQVLLGTLQVSSVTPVCCVPGTVYRTIECCIECYHVPIGTTICVGCHQVIVMSDLCPSLFVAKSGVYPLTPSIFGGKQQVYLQVLPAFALPYSGQSQACVPLSLLYSGARQSVYYQVL